MAGWSPENPLRSESAIVDLDQSAALGRSKQLVRPLAGDSMRLARDELVLKILRGWLETIVLGGHEWPLRFEPDGVFQLANVRPDVNGYVIHVDDVKLLHEIVAAARPSATVKARFPKGFGDIDIVWGSFFWLRQIQRDPAATPPFQDFAEEIYWLDVFVRACPASRNLA